MVYKNVKALEINTVLMHQATNLVWRKSLCAKDLELETIGLYVTCQKRIK